MITDRLGGIVVGLGRDGSADPEVAGQKAASLARLVGLGFPVPRGVVLSAAACRGIVDGSGMPAEVREALVGAVAELGEGPLAVRSSGVAEDLPARSYAGQYETVLGVVGPDALVEATRAVLASASSERLEAYRGADAGPAPMAVLIQRQVEADAAGVAFTANPITGDLDQVLVSAVRGLGERLVGGEAAPDEWVVRGEELEQIAAPEGAIREEDVRRVAELARSVERAMGAPQDIEWAVADGELFLLQARPITALPRRPEFDVPTVGTWEKDDGHYPAPLTPFGASVYLPALDAGTTKMCSTYGLLLKGAEQRSLGGEVYLHMIPAIGKEGGKERKPPPWWVLWVAARLVPEIRRRAKTAEEVFRTDLPGRVLERWDHEWRDELRRDAATLRAADLRALKDAELLGHLDRVKELLQRGEDIHFVLFPPYMMALNELGTACEDLLGWDIGRAISLVAGTSGASSEPGRRLGELARRAVTSPGVVEVLEQGGADVLERLDETAPGFAAEFRAYVDEHGHRTLSYDPGDPTLAERPELLAGLLRDRIADERMELAVEGVRSEAVAQARALLAGRPAEDRERFERALDFAERGYPVREDNIIWTDNVPAALLRYSAVEFGRRLAERNLLDEPEDAVFLEEGELRSALVGPDEDLRPLVARRRAERAWVIAHPGPARYGPDPGDPPDLRGLQPALRRVMEGLMLAMETMMPQRPEQREGEITGIAGSPGRHVGVARVIHEESEFDRLGRGDVLVCATTSPAWSVLFGQAGALVTDGGGVLAHAAVIAREYGIPAVVATNDGTRRIRDGQTVTVDGTAGVVRVG